MKKMQYLQPQTEVVLIKTNTHLLDASPNRIQGDNPEAILDPVNMKGSDGSDAASRHSLWDDEEDF